MVSAQQAYSNIISLLDGCSAEYKLFNHREALTYEDLVAVQKETGFIGTEGKCLVLKCDDNFIVYITLQGKRVNVQRIREVLGVKKIQLASAEDLKNEFDALPGCAYPFGFDKSIEIYIDPTIYKQEWFLFSPAISTATIQVR